jgi:hypothetical protein
MLPMAVIYRACESCSFWDKNGAAQLDLGACRRNAPTVLVASPQGNMSGWPTARRDHWCGEYEPSLEAGGRTPENEE